MEFHSYLYFNFIKNTVNFIRSTLKLRKQVSEINGTFVEEIDFLEKL